MEESPFKPLTHIPPHGIRHDAIFFVTICTEPRGLNQLCSATTGTDVLKAVRHYHAQGKWYCHLALLMPDHVHFLLGFPDTPSFSSIVGDWKRWITKHLLIAWQENFFDHRLRSEESLEQRMNYILQNPLRAGLTQETKDWPYQWRSTDRRPEVDGYQ